MATLNDFEKEVDQVLKDQAQPEAGQVVEEVDEDSDDDFRARIWNAEGECRKKELLVELAKEELKEAKAAYDDAVDRLRKLARESQQPTLFGMAKTEPADESWKERDFHEWLDDIDIDGLGQTKREALRDADIDTFGDFEALRVEAQKTTQHLSKLLPKGFGRPVTDEIEKAFLAARDE